MEITTQTTQSPSGHNLGHIRVGDIRGTFFVHHYQRGYRWDADDVQRLLDDIWDCKGQDYNLQPVVVKLDKKGNDELSHEWELIDGQQRLTTLYLIMHYMQQQGWKKMGAPYSISYKTHPSSATYLRTLDPVERTKNIDYFHLYQAYERIGQWFQKHGDEFAQENVASTFHSYLYKSVRVIWYEAPASEVSTELFTRLNVGRIPLTDAELIKALLLSGVRKNSSNRAQELAAQWDSIERDLHDPDVWAFVSGVDANNDAEKYPTRISLLLDTLADAKAKPSGKRPRYHTFDNLRGEIESNSNFWNQVVELHALILGWFSDPGLYNKIGYLVASHIPFGDLVKLANDKKKSEFNQLLTGVIRDDVIKMRKSGLLNLSYEEKKRGYPKLLQLLLLMNVETVSRTAQRFPFWRHKGKTWSLEHIHAQNAESLTTVEQWKSWLESHKQALLALPDNHDALIQEIEASLQGIATAKNFGDTFRRLSAQVIAVFDAPVSGVTTDHGLHSISNLALLSSGDNSALSNAVFEVKRKKILEIDRNEDDKKDGYIPICTRNVFLKYYADADAQQIHFWSPQDRESYYKAIISILDKDYLQPETKDEEAF